MSVHDDEYDAYRSKMAYFYGIVTAVDILVNIGKIEGGNMEVGCYRISTLYRYLWAKADDIFSTQAYFDLLSGLYGIKREMD